MAPSRFQRFLAFVARAVPFPGWYVLFIEPLLVRDLSRPGTPARVEVVRHGASFSFDLRDQVQRKLFCDSHQRRELEFVARHCRPGDTVIDVGANVGAFTIVAARAAAPDGEVHAFEPVPMTLRSLRQNIAANGLTNVHVIGEALSASPGDLRLALEDAEHGSGGYTTRGRLEAVTAPCTTLDAYVDFSIGDRPLRLLKIDVEGHEPHVLAGASATLRGDHRPDAVLVEVSEPALAAEGSSGEALMRALTDYGYALYTIGIRGRLNRYQPMTAERVRGVLRHAEETSSGVRARFRRTYWSYRLLADVVAVRTDRMSGP